MVCQLQGRIVNAPVGMTLVHNHISQIAKQAAELAVNGQDALMQHVRICDKELGAAANFSSLILHPNVQKVLLACR